MRRSFKYFTAAALLLALTVFSACSSSGAGSVNSSNGGVNSAVKNANGANSAVKTPNSTNSRETVSKNPAETGITNTTPLVMTADSLFTGDYGNYTGLVELEKKYKDRVLIVSDMYLWEITEKEITASDRMLSGGNFIKCEGDFTEYIDSATKVKQLRDNGDAVKGTVRGTVTDVRQTTDLSQAQITMNPCILTSLEK
ncbi:MAG: hypothetical protein WA584_19235 [Pyrinomonadaceae bacterium]